MLHADLAFDYRDAVLSGLLGVTERGDGATEQDQRLGDIAPRGLEASLVAVSRPAEQGAHVFLEHGERRVGEPGFQAGGLNREDRRPPRRFEIGDVLDGHDRPLVNQPGEAGGMNASDACGVNSQSARIFETVQQRNDVGGRRQLRIIPQPGEAGAAQLGIDCKQSHERIALRIGQPCCECIEGLFSRACTRSQPDSLQHRRRRKQDAVGSQMGEHRLDDGFAAIRGPSRICADPETDAPVGQSETAQGQVSLQFDRMFAARLIPLRVVGEDSGRHSELIGHEGDHPLRRLLSRCHAEAWIPEEAQLDGESEPVDRPPLHPDQRQVLRAEHVMAGHINRITRDREQPGSLLGGQQSASGHVGLRMATAARS